MDTSEDFVMHHQSKNQPHKRDKLSRVSDERDRFTDSDHKSLDAETLNMSGPYQDIDYPLITLCGLLCCITEGDERLVALTLKEAVELLKEPSIVATLWNAWREGSFKEVR